MEILNRKARYDYFVEEPVVAEEVIEEVVEDDAVIAAITAAVYMMMSANKSAGHPEFVIRKIREIRR